MRKSIFLFSLVIGMSQAFADFYEDIWTITNSNVVPSTAKKADGSVINVPGESVLNLSFETSRSYGGENRWIKNQSVQGNVISIDIETSGDLQCSDHAPEVSLGMMAPDNARAAVVLSAGEYQLVLNGHVAGSVKVSDQGTAEVVQSENYAKEVQAANYKKLNDTINPYLSYGLHGEAIKVDLKSTTEGIMATYWIAEEKGIDRKTGQMVVKSKEVKSSALLKRPYVNWSCRSPDTVAIEIENEERDVILKISQSPGWESVILIIQDKGFDISLKKLN